MVWGQRCAQAKLRSPSLGAYKAGLQGRKAQWRQADRVRLETAVPPGLERGSMAGASDRPSIPFFEEIEGWQREGGGRYRLLYLGSVNHEEV